jgi:two-component system sensor histidine kinase HydH
MAAGDHSKPFNLLRWFAWLSPIVIAATALANAWLISNFLNNHLFQREASISREFVQNILVADGSLEFLTRPNDAVLAERFRNTVEHLSSMRDVLRANVFGQDRTILWSSDPQLIGRRFADNDELDDAMKGELVVHAGRITASTQQKREHEGLNPSIEFFVESYIPVKRPDGGQIVGVVELYKAPLALSEAINEGRVQVGLTALGSALLLYLTLFWMIRRADSTIQRQHSRLIEAETLAVVGELTSSVAHNIRNPLSSIRSAAELALEAPTDDCSEQANDIIREVDRISARITEQLI